MFTWSVYITFVEYWCTFSDRPISTHNVVVPVPPPPPLVRARGLSRECVLHILSMIAKGD